MKISRNKIPFCELHGGDTFLTSEKSTATLCMKFMEEENNGRNCIRLEDGAVFAMSALENVIKVECELKY